MDPLLLQTFQRQVKLQCDFVIASAFELNSALNGGSVPECFLRIQNLLNAAANISKAFWGAGSRFVIERKPLRDSVGILDDSVLKSVTMRNNFEHLDERLEKWWRQSKGHSYIDMNVSDGTLVIGGVENIDRFRDFNAKTTELTFWGDTFNIQEIVTEVEKLLPRLIEELNKVDRI